MAAVAGQATGPPGAPEPTRGVGGRRATIPRLDHTSEVTPVNPFLAIGQIIVSIALIGSDPAPGPRDGPVRRPSAAIPPSTAAGAAIERRLFQFTIVLLVLFVLFSLAAYISRRPPDAASCAGRGRAARRTTRRRLTQRDRAIVAALSALFVVLALALAICSAPAGRPGRRRARARGSAAASPAPPAVYREGILGRPSSISPLTARTQADRDLVALVFSGLVALGTGRDVVPDLADAWTVDSSGATWTFNLRADARWQDGEPVTSADVVFTIGAPQDRPTRRPGQLVARGDGHGDSTTQTVGSAWPPRSAASSRTPGRILPEHLLGQHAGRPTSADSAVRQRPDRLAGHSALRPLGTRPPADLIPASTPPPGGRCLPGDRAPLLRRTRRRSPRPTGPAQLDAGGGLAAGRRARPSRDCRARACSRYPRTTFTAVAINLRRATRAGPRGRPEGAPPGPRPRRRSLTGVLAGTGNPGRHADPADLVGVRPEGERRRSPATPSAAATALKEAGWTKADGGWEAPKAKEPFTFELLSPDQASQPGRLGRGRAGRQPWRPFGLEGRPTSASHPAELVDGRLGAGDFVAAVVDVNIGLDPDLYPLLASTQTMTGGREHHRDPGSDLDGLLAAARRPGTDGGPQGGLRGPPDVPREATRSCSRCSSQDDVVVVSSRVTRTDRSGRLADPVIDIGTC